MTLAILKSLWALAVTVWKLFPPKVWAGIGLVLLLVFYHLYAIHEARVGGIAEGMKTAQAQCAAEKKAAADDYAKRAKEAEDKAKAQEQQQETQLAALGATYAKQLNDAKTQHDLDVAAARAGTIQLRVAGMLTGTAAGGAAPSTSTPSAGSDGPATAELPPAVAGSLLGLADDADAVVAQLTTCQATVNTYLKGKS